MVVVAPFAGNALATAKITEIPLDGCAARLGVNEAVK